jgi:hypothetical protein
MNARIDTTDGLQPPARLRLPPEVEPPPPKPPAPPLEIHKRPHGKPFAFALAHGEGGASTWFGQLLACVTLIDFERREVAGELINVLSQQPPIPGINPVAPENLDTAHRLQTHLGWYGDVYIYWEANEDGEITLCDVRGPDEPEGEDISLLPETLVRVDPTGAYFIKLGTVDENSPVDQLVSSDVPWMVTICRGMEEPSSGSSGSSAPSEESSAPSEESSAPSGAESSKDSAIVLDRTSKTGLTRWYTYEEPEVRFGDRMVSTNRIELRRRVARLPIDYRVQAMCEKNFEVDGWSADTPCPLGFAVKDGYVEVTSPARPVAALFGGRPNRVVVHLTATRRGFLGRRLESATLGELVANERRLQLKATADEINEFLRQHTAREGQGP